MVSFKGALLLFALAVVPRTAFADDPGSALRFDGASDFVRLSTTTSMVGAGWQTTKSVSLWVKPTGTPTCTGPDPGSCDAIFGDRPRSWGISRGVLGGSDRIWVWNYDGTYDRIGIPYTVGEWIQVGLVHGGGLLSAYKNGAFVGSLSTGASPAGNATGQLHVGGMITNATKNWTFEGEIDEVQLWSVARSAADMFASWNHLLTGGESGLAAYYKMSNGSGLSLTDDSGHGWTGTLTDGGSGVPADGPITWVLSGAFGGGNPGNIPPVANPQSVSTAEDVAVAITLTGSDANGDTITFRVVTPPAHGVLSGSGANLLYTPAADYHGPDSFTFVANDGTTDSAPATVSLTITPVQDSPVANDDVAGTSAATPVVVAVLANDFDVDLHTLNVTAAGPALHGTVSHNGTTVTYTPETGFTGTDGFDYTISDGHGGTASATVTMTVSPPGSGAGHALKFDGLSDYVRVAPTAAIMAPDWETTKTVSLWLKPNNGSFCNAPSPASCDAIIGDRPRWWGISRGVISGLDRIWVWNFDGGLQAIAIEYTPGAWVHISMVHGAGTLTAYKNGVLVGSVASGATQQPSTGAFPVLQFGGIINTVARNWTFHGPIDEVQIWNVARTQAEVNDDMSGELQGSEIGLAAYYKMSDGSGASVTDDSGHGWTGELHDGGQGVPADGPIEWVPSGAFQP